MAEFCTHERHGGFCEKTDTYCNLGACPYEDMKEYAPVQLGQWNWKHRRLGGFRRYTGVDSFGETHTITVDERIECDEPYCPYCGKWNESVFLNFCPNCGAKMDGDRNG